MKSSSRNGKKVRLLALHTTEGIRKNSDLLSFFNRADAQGSSHASADPTGLLEEGFVPYDRAAWTLRSGNSISDNLEQCGFAKWSREEWLGPQIGTIWAAALWVARRASARDIPIRTLTHDQLRKGEAGVIQHNDWTVAMKDGSHWDCGPNYPIDVVIDLAREHNALPPTPPQPPIVGGRPVLRIGMMNSPQVLAVQKWANRWFPSYASTPLSEDGDFGPGTERFVKEFQSRVSLQTDGIVGPNTWNKMYQNGFK
jgi:peptidoglycan hydrolase-like protein with peptidoglycan-binding domain